MRQQLGYDDHIVSIVMQMFGDQAQKNARVAQAWPNFTQSMQHGIAGNL